MKEKDKLISTLKLKIIIIDIFSMHVGELGGQ